MTSRDVMLSLLRREIPERMGIFEHYWGETLPAWRQQGFPENVDPEDYFDYDLRCVDGSWFDSSLRPHFTEEVIEETSEWKVRKDGRGATLKYWKAKSGTPQHIAFEVTSPEAWAPYREAVATLDTSRVDVAAVRQGLQKCRAGDKLCCFSNLFILEIMRGTLGDICMMESFLLEPQWIKEFCAAYTRHYIIHYDYLFREAGKPDAFFIYDDLGFSNGLFCSPAVMKELLMPFYREFVGFLHDNGLPVLLHSCGDVRKAVPMIVEAGFDCLQPMEAKAGNNVIEFAAQFGRKISFMGNIDVTVLNRNNPDGTRAEVLRKVRPLRELRVPYIFHSDHSIPPDIRFDTYRAAVETFRSIARY